MAERPEWRIMDEAAYRRLVLAARRAEKYEGRVKGRYKLYRPLRGDAAILGLELAGGLLLIVTVVVVG